MATDKTAVKSKPEDRAMAADKQPRKDRVRPQGPVRTAGPGPMQKANKYLSEVRTELKKTNWPTKPELIAQTQVVIGLLIVVGTFIASWDFILGHLFALILRLLGVPNTR
jgi:preprotein translocase subunit SecE